MKSLSLIPWLVLETLVNELLSRDANSPERLQKLAGKVLRFDIKELPFVVTVTVEQQVIRLSTSAEGDADCWIQTELGVLPELTDNANLTRLIKAGQLDIEGDPMLAQQLVMLVKGLDIDWESELEAKLGVLPAQWLSNLWRSGQRHMKEASKSHRRWINGVVIEEKRLLPARIEFEQFKQQLQQLRATIERLERQVKQEQ